MSTDVDSTTAVTMAARAIAHHPCEIPAVMRSEKQPTSTLPDVTVDEMQPVGDSSACNVCGDTVAGFHCGAYVCEACKVRTWL